MTKEEILAAAGYPNTPEGVAAFYNEYGTPEAFFAKHGGSLSGAPHNGQPTADQFFSYGSHANDQINIPMGNPFYLQTGGMYHSDGPFYHARDGINVTFAQPKTSAQYNRMKNKLRYTDEELKGVGVSKPGLSEQFLQKQKKLKGTYKPATGGGYTMIGEDPSKVYDYYVGQGYKLRGMPDVASTLPPQRYGGGLPGGPHEMPCMECGGYMDMGGYNSPTNYGSFSVPMNNGGLPMGQPGTIVDWAKKEQQALQQRTGMTTPSEAKRYFGAFEAPSPEQMDSIHVSPINPNIGMGFKGGKSMLLPLNKSAAQDVYKINKPFTLATPPQKGEREVFVQYQEFGGAYDPSVAGTYPMLDMGGLKKIIYAAAKKTKKAYGGDTVIPGGNQDYKEQYRNTFDNFIKQNTYNAIVDNEREAMMNALAQMDQPSYNMPMGGYDMDFAQKGKQTGYNQANTQRSKVMEGLANMFAPTYRTGLFSNIVPANIYRGYEFSNKDYDYLKSLGDDAKISGLSMEYGPLARGLGKFGRRMFGPKSITFGVTGPEAGYYEDNLSMTQMPWMQEEKKRKGLFKKKSDYKGPYPDAVEETSNLLEGMEKGELYKDYNKGVTLPGRQRSDLMPSNLSKYQPEKPIRFEDAEYKEVMPPAALSNQQNNPSMEFAAGKWIPKAADGVQNPIKMEPDYLASKSPVGLFEDYAEAGLKQSMSQAEHLKNPQTGSMYNTTPVTAKRETDWSSLASYAPGAINTLAASFEESSPMGLIGRGSARYRKNEADKRQAAMYTPGSNQGPFVSTPSSARDMGNYTINQGMFRPDDAAYAQSPGNIYGYAQMGGYVEGEELDLSPEQIAELIAQGYEIEELD